MNTVSIADENEAVQNTERLEVDFSKLEPPESFIPRVNSWGHYTLKKSCSRTILQNWKVYLSICLRKQPKGMHPHLCKQEYFERFH